MQLGAYNNPENVSNDSEITNMKTFTQAPILEIRSELIWMM